MAKKKTNKRVEKEIEKKLNELLEVLNQLKDKQAIRNHAFSILHFVTINTADNWEEEFGMIEILKAYLCKEMVESGEFGQQVIHYTEPKGDARHYG